MTYNPPSDFTLPSPPYYRPASFVTLTCVVYGATDPVQYQWSTTNTASFAQNKVTSSISQRILTSSDAGEHTCTVTDADGSMVHASTQMTVVGKSEYLVY